MKRKPRSDNGEVDRYPTDREIDEAMNEAALDALYLHLAADLPLAVERDGKVEFVHPSEFKIAKHRQRSPTTPPVKPLGYD